MRHFWLTSDAPDLPDYAFQRRPLQNRPSTLEGKGGGSAPAAPDPWTTAAATTRSNEDTAAFNKALNLNNYSNPFGSQSSNIIGWDNSGAPIYNTTTSVNSQLGSNINSLLSQAGNSSGANSDAMNSLYGINMGAANLGNSFSNLAGQFNGLNAGISALSPQYSALSGNIGNLQGQYSGLNSQLSGLGNQLNMGAVQQAQQKGQDAAYAAQTQYLDPQFSQQKESLDASLANSGLTPGSEAYNNAMTNYNNTKQQAYSNAQNQSILTGSQLGAQNLQNQISGINTQAGLLGQQSSNLGQQAGLYGQQAGLLGNQAGLYGLMGQNLSGASQAYGQQGTALGQQAGIAGQLSSLANMPYSQLSSLAGLVPGFSGTGQASANPADIAGYLNNQYQANLAGYNANQASANQTTSTVGTIGAAAAIALGF